MVDRWFQRFPPAGRGLRSSVFRRLYEIAIHDVLETLDTVGASYWVTEGTLIELMRFGRNHPPETGRAVDHDVDVMIEVSCADAWPPLAEEITQQLSARGWQPEPLTSTSSQIGARRDKLRCWIRGEHFARTRCDLHSYVADYGRNVAWSHADALSYPFQRWGGFLPLDLIHPMGTCLCYARMAPAPRDPVGLLRGWNDGEYDRPCMAFPRRGAGRKEVALVIDYALRLDRMGVQSFLTELQQQGILESA